MGELILAIETSFDDAAIAAIDGDGRIAASAQRSSIGLHREWGGVVPEIAARSHVTDLPLLYEEIRLRTGEISFRAIAVTCGPGLVGSLLAGVNFAEGLAFALCLPVLGLNHLEGHILSPFLESTDDGARQGKPLAGIPFPHLALVVSGGNTILVRADGLGEYSVLGETQDDAGGELLDKIAVALGRDYPGGATIERLASAVDAADPETARWLRENPLPVPMRESGDLNFSYSGLKTAALRQIHVHGIKEDHPLEPLFAYNLQAALAESLWIKVRDAAQIHRDCRVFSASGGVAANGMLLSLLLSNLSALGVALVAPEKALAVDNAEMMAYLAWLKLGQGNIPQGAPGQLDADPNLRL